jgi:hypothetical protein
MALDDVTRERVAAFFGERVPVGGTFDEALIGAAMWRFGIDPADEHEVIHELMQVAWARGATVVRPVAE